MMSVNLHPRKREIAIDRLLVTCCLRVACDREKGNRSTVYT
jgi:hypothetical protein